MERLDGRRIIVTGGASGMGQMMVEGFARLGAKVVSFDWNAEAGEKAAASVGAGFIRVDVGDGPQVKEAVGQAAQQMGGIDVLAHAAAIDSHCPAEKLSDEAWEKVFRVNAAGTFHINKAVFPYMRENENGGTILNFTSASAYTGSGPNGGQCCYAATKGAVSSWTRAVAAEWMKYNIRVNAIAPCIWTPMYDQTRAILPPEQVAAMDANLANICLGGRLGDPETDFLPVMAFLASPGAKFITGQTICIDGGVLMVR